MAASNASTLVEINVDEYKSTAELTKLANAIERAKSNITVSFKDSKTGETVGYQVSPSYAGQHYSCEVSSKFSAVIAEKYHAFMNRFASATKEEKAGNTDIPMEEISAAQRFIKKWGAKGQAEMTLKEMVSELNNYQRFNDFCSAATYGHLDLLEKSLRAGVSVDRRDRYTGENALLMAVKHSQYDCAEVLLKHGALTNRLDSRRNIPIDVAVTRRDDRMVELLLAHGASTRMKDESTELVFHKACRRSSESIVNSFLSRDKQLVTKLNHWRTPPLMLACENGNLGAVKALLAHDADVMKADNYGNLPLQKAVERGDYEIAQALIDAGADPKLRDASGDSAVDKARNYQYVRGKADLMALVNPVDISEETLQEWEQADKDSKGKESKKHLEQDLGDWDDAYDMAKEEEKHFKFKPAKDRINTLKKK
ncbi:ankyrin repeat domain-containing protein [Parashewanella tropica]|uniref:ankyrin repeat domain-containing protein n=1 Tax=Parashewanella tropica TaxID=2547970 RepID=UPI00105A2E36|nr:ankyrin repeat domain-containing protein [Parashewanella tropica]